jgi:hypothetical protein
LKVPGPQLVQKVLPLLGECMPTTQAKQVDAAAAPTVAEYVPATHGPHVADAPAPAAAE